VEALLDFGERVQESVFVADLDEELAGRMLARVRAAVEETEDAVHVFALCERCWGGVTTVGKGRLPEDRTYYVF
jgi:CRISPR-associated endonuclease Cas2